jgi:Fe-S-cluster-containing hydrogenase component 2
MEDDVFVKLRRHLDNFFLRAPEADSILEILRIRFTPEEAEVALTLGQSHEELSELAKRANRNEKDLRLILEQMTDKALVYKKTETQGGVTRELYGLLPTAIGLWETSFATGERNPRTEHLARLWREYYKSGWGKAMFGSVPFTRVIPVGRSIDASNSEIFPYEKAIDLIKKHDYAVVLHCPCRKSAELDGAGCGRPTETCLHFGDLARFMADRGYAREVSQEEALEILEATEKAGLVHMVANSKEMGVAMCSCCTCCCTQLRAIAEFSIPNVMAQSRFVAQVEPETCISCEVCEERCQFHAVSVVGEAASVDTQRCHGCGLCVTACSTGAMSLKEREAYEEPVDTLMQLVEAWSK